MARHLKGYAVNKKLRNKIMVGVALAFLAVGCRKKPQAGHQQLSVASRLRGKERILIIGDSLSSSWPPKKVEYEAPFGGAPGHVLARLLTDNGSTVLINAIGGRSALGFVNGTTCTARKNKVCVGVKEPAPGVEQIEQIAKTFRPQTAIILLGTNDAANIAIGGSQKAVLGAFDRIITALRAQGIKVIGVGPPSFSDDFTGEKQNHGFDGGKIERASAVLAGELRKRYGDKFFIDSRPMTANITEPSQGRTADKIHFGGKAAEKWATQIFQQLTGAN
jgi:lysophospholipase L1-like esterase